VFSQALIEQANKDNRIVAITAAMPKGTGLTEFKKSFPNRFYDVGIAEQHAVTLAAGMAVSGLRPVFAVYSTFSQRAYDQILHDVCIQNLPVIFAIDRAGLVGEDGETHQGIFDISFLRALPNMHIFAPSNERELKNALELALTINGPCAIRFPKGEVMADRNEPLIHWKWNKVVNGDGCAIIAFGRMLEVAINAAELIKAEGHNVAVYNAGFIKPLDTETLKQIASEYNVVFTLEDSILAGGFGQACATEVMDSCKIINIGINDSFVAHGAVEQLLAELELDTEGVAKRIRSELK
jgi:1-deoxy-D-xylulose-5-phosphate synthase